MGKLFVAYLSFHIREIPVWLWTVLVSLLTVYTYLEAVGTL